MVVPGSLKADNHGSADVAEPIDETIMLSSGIQNEELVVATCGRLDQHVIALT